MSKSSHPSETFGQTVLQFVYRSTVWFFSLGQQQTFINPGTERGLQNIFQSHRADVDRVHVEGNLGIGKPFVGSLSRFPNFRLHLPGGDPKSNQGLAAVQHHDVDLPGLKGRQLYRVGFIGKAGGMDCSGCGSGSRDRLERTFKNMFEAFSFRRLAITPLHYEEWAGFPLVILVLVVGLYLGSMSVFDCMRDCHDLLRTEFHTPVSHKAGEVTLTTRVASCCRKLSQIDRCRRAAVLLVAFCYSVAMNVAVVSSFLMRTHTPLRE